MVYSPQHSQENKKKYRHLCNTEETIPLFSQAWWLDATAGREHWDVILIKQDNKIVGSLPFIKVRKFGFKIITQPPLTQTLGPWLRPGSGKPASQLDREKKLLTALAEQLPDFDYYKQNWHSSQTNWIPFFWKGFKQTTRYSYILDDLSDLDTIWNNLKSNIKTDIRKATSRAQLAVRDDLGVTDFYNLNRKVFERQGRPTPYSLSLLEQVDKAASQRGTRKIFIAEDSRGKQHAGAYIVWDRKSAYYLMGGSDPELRNSGATSLCLWEAIRHAASVTRKFDFEGSMLEPVERYFRAFGAIQVPYFSVSKSQSFLIKTLELFRE